MPISPTSAKANVPAVDASNTDPVGGTAIHGYAAHGHGVEGGSQGSKGVVGMSEDFQGVYGHSGKNAGVVGESSTWVGVYGKSMGDTGIAVMGEASADPATGVSGNGTGIFGVSTNGVAVHGYAAHGHGVEGGSQGSKGVVGTSEDFQGVYGHSGKNAGVVGESSTWVGVYGKSMGDTGIAVMGEASADPATGVSGNGTGIFGVSTNGAGVRAASENGEAIHAETNSLHVAAAAILNNNEHSDAAALYARKSGAVGDAGYFDGNVHIQGDAHITGKCTVDVDLICTGADLAEQFCVVGDRDAEPGCVVVLAGDDQICVSEQPYDRRVAGIVSGAGPYRPAVVLDGRPGADRRPLALTGKVWCKVDADMGAIAVGDLLTTSPTPGHAMRAVDPARAFGAVVGKALAGLTTGCGLVPVLVSLQ